MTIAANNQGIVAGKFTVPSGIPAGRKAVTALGAGGSYGEAIFSGQGTLERQLFQQQTTITETRWQSAPPPFPFVDSLGAGGSDPLAQTFTLANSAQISDIDLMFVVKPTSKTRVQIRETIAGVPSSRVLAESVLLPAQILTNDLSLPGGGATSNKSISLNDTGSIIIPAGVTSVSLVGAGGAGVSAVSGVAPTYGNWTYSIAQPSSPSTMTPGTNVPSYLTVGDIPNNVSSLPGSFNVAMTSTGSFYLPGGPESLTFTPTNIGGASSDTSKTYKATTSRGDIILLFFGRTVSGSGTTGVAAAAGLSATATANGTTRTFAGAASGVTTAPADTTQTITLSGSTSVLLTYNVPFGTHLVANYVELSNTDDGSGQPIGNAKMTRAAFTAPVLLLGGVEYAMVVLCNDAVGSLAIAELSKFDNAAQKWITEQPYTVGVLLSSSNGSTWTAHQDRDLTFAIQSAAFTETTHTVALGTVAVVNATDLMLMAYSERPASITNVKYTLTLPSGTVLAVDDGQPVQLTAAITGNVTISATLTGSADASPILYPGIQLVYGNMSGVGNYITRAIPAGSSARIKVIYEAIIPSGAGVTVIYKGIDGGDTWAAVTALSNRPVDDGFTEFTHQITGVNETAIQVQLIETGTPSARPRVRDLRVIVL